MDEQYTDIDLLLTYHAAVSGFRCAVLTSRAFLTLTDVPAVESVESAACFPGPATAQRTPHSNRGILWQLTPT